MQFVKINKLALTVFIYKSGARMQNKPIQSSHPAVLPASTANNKSPIQKEKPYTYLKYQEACVAASNKLIEFFTVHNIKKFMDYEKKTRFQRELIDQILRQLRQFLRKKAKRELQILINKEEGEEEIKLERKFEAYDEIYMRSVIMDGLKKEQPDRIDVSPFEVYDVQDEILDQLQASLVKIYNQI